MQQRQPLAVLVTGGTGFIGSHLLRLLATLEDVQVAGLVRASSNVTGFPKGKMTLTPPHKPPSYF
jgi:thioester reductase-like protein